MSKKILIIEKDEILSKTLQKQLKIMFDMIAIVSEDKNLLENNFIREKSIDILIINYSFIIDKLQNLRQIEKKIACSKTLKSGSGRDRTWNLEI